jgi:NAD(P)-dependent dehydrogenase (short-subunit alcohol dehydrogenase family)
MTGAGENLRAAGRSGLPLAVVIGAAGGMGAACARRLGQAHRVLLADRDEDAATRIAEQMAADGQEAEAAACDVTDPASLDRLFERAATLGGVRSLAHVVGLSPSMASGNRILDVNLAGAARTAAAALPLMTAGSAAVFISSLAAHGAPPGADMTAVLDDPLAPDLLERIGAVNGGEPDPRSAYQLSKFGLNRMCRHLAAPWGARGARIVSLSPGLIRTPMGDLEFGAGPQKLELLARTPLQRQGSLVEIADALEFLLSDRASFINGTDLLVDGGIAAALAFPRGN